MTVPAGLRLPCSRRLPYLRERSAHLREGLGSLGVKTLAVCSDGTAYDNPRHLLGNLAKLRRLQKAHSRRQNGSRRKALMRAMIGELHAQIHRDRMDWFRKTAAAIVAKPCVVLETLNPRGMVRNRRLARAISGLNGDIRNGFGGSRKGHRQAIERRRMVSEHATV